MVSFEEKSFRNLVTHFADELRPVENNPKVFTQHQRVQLLRKGVIEIGRPQYRRDGSHVVLTERAKKVLRELDIQ